MLGHLIDYWHYTGDDTYNDVVKQAMIHQVGDDSDYMPGNQTRQLGNDDQGYWALTAMTAAERVFPDPPKDKPQWLALVQAVFNEFVGRWDKQHCEGGLRWQIFNFNVGWNYKNSVSNGCFFNIAARLARYTGNTSYADWADTVWDWEAKMGLVDEKQGLVKDGVTIQDNKPCSNDLDSNEWSYNSGTFLLGCAALYEWKGDEKWKKRATGFLDHGLTKFVKEQVVYEQFCEPHKTCDDDQRTFKGYYLRSLSTAAQLIPEFKTKIQPIMKATAQAAAGSCTGPVGAALANHPAFDGHDGTACGFSWLPKNKYDDTSGVPQQMNALAALTYVLDAKKPVSKDSGGTSKGDPNAGSADSEKTRTFEPITIGDKVGAGFLTTLVLAGVIGGCSFLII